MQDYARVSPSLRPEELGPSSPLERGRPSFQDDRRARRSDDVMTALHYQLAFARHQGGFDALILADSAGCLVAGAGAWPTCEMLAAYAPLLAHPASPPVAGLGDDGTEVEVRKLMIDGSEVLLCAR